MMKVSIIVPVYNVEPYLRQCLDSIIHQTYQNIEVLVVNDGSPDNSQKIIDEFVQMDSRIKGLIKENGGLSDARNFALPYVSGQYLFFLDSDDYMKLDTIEKLVEKVEQEKADLVFCGYQEVYQNGDRVDVISKEEISGSFAQNPEILNTLPHCAWNKLYKKELFTDYGIIYPKGLYYEDAATSPRLYLHATNMQVVHEGLIQYRVDRPGNITGVVSRKVLDVVKDLEIVNDYYQSQGVFDLYLDALETFNVRLIYDNLWKLKQGCDHDFIDEMLDQCFAHLDRYFKNWRKNKYFRTSSLKQKIVNKMRVNKEAYKKYLKG